MVTYYILKALLIFIPVPKWRRSYVRYIKRKFRPTEEKMHEMAWRLWRLSLATSDPKGIGMLDLMMDNAGVPDKYKHLFYNMPDDVQCIDCGVNVGLVSDMFLFLGARVVGFEPNPAANNILRKKYRDDDRVKIIEAAVSDKNGEVEFCKDAGHSFDTGGNIVGMGGDSSKRDKYKVPAVRLADKLLELKEQVYILKLDVEGAEFYIIPDLIKTGAYKKCTHIVCETHARFFDDGEARLLNMEKLIEDNGITNIHLDWV